jgi:Phage integrase family
MADQRIEEWERWLSKSVANDVYLMHLERHVWLRTHEIVRENGELKNTISYFWEWLFDLYVKAQAGAVRRQADERKDVASLARLLLEIKNTPDLLTRDWYLDHWGKDESYDENDKAYWRKAGETEWSKNFGGEVGDHIDPSIVAADLTELRQGSKKVRVYVNKHVAHFDAGGISGTPFQAATIYRRADRTWKAQALGRLRLHQARHAYASFMIAAGVNAKALSSFMGHSSIKVTFDLYGHLMPGTEAEAAALLDTFLAPQVHRAEQMARRARVASSEAM